MSGVEAVLAAHIRQWDVYSPHCSCGRWRDKRDDGTGHAVHVAAELALAGIGDVAEAEARGAEKVRARVEALDPEQIADEMDSHWGTDHVHRLAARRTLEVVRAALAGEDA